MSFDLQRKDTICALATAPSPAALNVIRVSGKESAHVLRDVFRPRHQKSVRAHMATLGDIVDDTGGVVDEGIALFFPEGKSYTGEASFEFMVHGGPSRARAVLNALLARGVRLAEPGEFTLRAVLTGRIDLTAAEAVLDVIHAKSDEAARVALAAVKGELGEKLRGFRDVVVSALAEFEARLDFPDEELGDAETAALITSLDDAADGLYALEKSGARGRRLTEGARVVLYGAPNAGKSTLFNHLVGEERAIVHERAGTTRDVLEGLCIVDGVPLTVVDVAGVRDPDGLDPVEQIGIGRATGEMERADLVLHLHAVDDDVLVDSDARPHDGARYGAVTGRIVDVITKIDLAPDTRVARDAIGVSTRTGAGLDALKAAMLREVGADRYHHDEVVLTRARQIEEVALAKDAIRNAARALDVGHVHEVVASELRAAGRALDRVLGLDLDEDVLNEIFSRFCIGK